MSTAIELTGIGSIRCSAGLYSLNDLHRASGGKKRHQPSDFLRTDQTRALALELSRTGNSRFIETTKGRNASTYVCRELVIAYAAWISPFFHLKVIRHFLESERPAAPIKPRRIHTQETTFWQTAQLVPFQPDPGSPPYMYEAWFTLLVRACEQMRVITVAAALSVCTGTVSQVRNGLGKYGSGKCSTESFARRVIRALGPRSSTAARHFISSIGQGATRGTAPQQRSLAF